MERTAANYRAASFNVFFVRDRDQEVTEFLGVAEINGTDRITLVVAPGHRRRGGIVHLPAGTVEWSCCPGAHPSFLPPFSIRSEDHPDFRPEGWLSIQRDCAHLVRRLHGSDYQVYDLFNDKLMEPWLL